MSYKYNPTFKLIFDIDVDIGLLSGIDIEVERAGMEFVGTSVTTMEFMCGTEVGWAIS